MLISSLLFRTWILFPAPPAALTARAAHHIHRTWLTWEDGILKAWWHGIGRKKQGDVFSVVGSPAEMSWTRLGCVACLCKDEERPLYQLRRRSALWGRWTNSPTWLWPHSVNQHTSIWQKDRLDLLGAPLSQERTFWTVITTLCGGEAYCKRIVQSWRAVKMCM